jgi:hypothetical protein
MEKATKADKTRQLSIEQQNAIGLLLQGKSDRVKKPPPLPSLD